MPRKCCNYNLFLGAGILQIAETLHGSGLTPSTVKRWPNRLFHLHQKRILIGFNFKPEECMQDKTSLVPVAPFSRIGDGEGCFELEGTSESAVSNEILVPPSFSEELKPSNVVDVELDDEGLLDSMTPGTVFTGLAP